MRILNDGSLKRNTLLQVTRVGHRTYIREGLDSLSKMVTIIIKAVELKIKCLSAKSKVPLYPTLLMGFAAPQKSSRAFRDLYDKHFKLTDLYY